MKAIYLRNGKTYLFTKKPNSMIPDLLRLSKSAMKKLEDIGFTIKTENCEKDEIFLASSNSEDSVRITFFFGARDYFAFSIAKMNRSESTFEGSYLEKILRKENIDYKADLLKFVKDQDEAATFQDRYQKALNYNIEKIKQLASLGKLDQTKPQIKQQNIEQMKVDLQSITKETFQKLDEIGFTLRAEQSGAGDVFLSYANHDDTKRINFFFGVREFFSISIAEKKPESTTYQAEHLEEKLKAANTSYDRNRLIFDNKKVGAGYKEKYVEAINYNIEKIQELFKV